MRLALLLVMLPLAAHAQDGQHGYQLFTTIGCSECHGTVGQGSRTSGPRLAPRTPPMAAFLQELRHPVNEMPPYPEASVPDADAADIYAYLSSIPAPKLSAKDIPALNQ